MEGNGLFDISANAKSFFYQYWRFCELYGESDFLQCYPCPPNADPSTDLESQGLMSLWLSWEEKPSDK